jgi:hypothetical protein
MKYSWNLFKMPKSKYPGRDPSEEKTRLDNPLDVVQPIAPTSRDWRGASPPRSAATSKVEFRTPQPGSPAFGRRWVAGPIVAALTALGTVLVLSAVSSRGESKVQKGRLLLHSNPEGALVFVEGQRQPLPTPTIVDAEVGVSLHVLFQMGGYENKEADVYVGAGEHPFRVKLDPRLAAPAPARSLE